MRIFVTGATGFVGSAVVQDLIGAGHEVLGLARSNTGAAALEKMGAEVHRDSLEALGSLRSAAAKVDGVIHTAFNHDFSRFKENCELDRHAIEALGAVLEGSDRPLLVTHGVALLAEGRIATEADAAPSVSDSYPRASEAAAAVLAARGVRVASVRLPSSVHGEGDHAFVPHLITVAREQGVSAYVGDGLNRWAAVHRLDAARVYRMALEHNFLDGPYHAVAEEGVPFKAIAEAIGRHLNVPVVGKTPAEARSHFGWFASFAQMDTRASSKQTQALLN